MKFGYNQTKITGTFHNNLQTFMSALVTIITTDFLVIKFTFVVNTTAAAVTNLNDVQWLLKLCKFVKNSITLSAFRILLIFKSLSVRHNTTPCTSSVSQFISVEINFFTHFQDIYACIQNYNVNKLNPLVT